MTLEILDLVPRPYGPYRGVRPGAAAAFSERNMLEIMASIGLTAQARLMRNGPARAAEGWSAAEEGAYKAARALNLLTQAMQRLAKIHEKEPRFIEEREFGEIKIEPRIYLLAEQALVSTDPLAAQTSTDRLGGEDARAEKIRAYIELNNRRRQDYWDATFARLREYDPNWVSFQQHSEALEAAEQAVVAVEPARPQPAPARPPETAAWQADPDRARRAKEKAENDHIAAARLAKTQERVDVGAVAGASISGSGSAKPPPSPHPDQVPPPPKRRGAQAGNVLALKAGRHTGDAVAERAADNAMLREVRKVCAEANELAAELTALKPGSG